MQHGLTKTYRAGCRCKDCRKANTVYYRELRARRKAGEPPRSVPPHGTKSRYSNQGCRCDLCRQASNEHMKQWRLHNPKLVKAVYKRTHTKRRKWLDEQKAFRWCLDCGFIGSPESMQHDHRVRKDKVHNVSSLMASNRPLAVIAQEILKCDLVCANCHAVRTRVTYSAEAP